MTQQIDNPHLPRSSQYHVLMQYDLVGQLIVRHSSHYPEIIGNESNKPARPQYHRIRYDYNEIGQLISAINPNSRTNLAYDEGGRLITETLISHLTQAGQYQAREQTLQHDYDELGNRIATTLPDGKVINQLYYGSGHLYNQSLHDPSTDEHIELRHSERNKLHLEVSRQQGVLDSKYTYDPMGRLIKQQSKSYHTIHRAKYSKADEYITIQRDYHYDALGQLISAVNPNSRTNLAYDEGGRLITETLISHLTQAGQYQAREQTLQHDYDALGNRIATTLPCGKVINQLYYGSGHLYNQSLHDPSTDEYIELRHSERNKLHLEISRQQGALESSYNYDPMGRLIKQYSKNDEHLTIQRDYHYDALGQLTHLSGHSLLGSNKRTQNNTVNQNQFTRNHQYQYDLQGRLTEHKLTDYQNHTGITEVFAFDPASNRVPVKIADDTADNTQTDHGRPRELVQNGKRIRYTYDSHGRVLYKTTEALTNPDKEPRTALQLQYNASNELEKSLLTQYEGNQVIKTQALYNYDAFGRRIAKQSEVRQLSDHQGQLTQSSKTQYKRTHMLWDSDLPIQEYSDTHVYTTIYDQGSFKPVARLAWLRDDLSEVANDDIKNIDHEQDGSLIQVYHYHNDQLGTPNELTNQQGEVVWLADYEAWGNTAKLVYSSIQINQIKVSQNELQPIRFQGQHFDTETGLHYNRFRYYDPDMGMFTTRDPIGLRGGDNVFQYAPNPTGWIDPLGLVTRKEAINSLINDSKVQPDIKAKVTRQHGNVPASYSPAQINERWFELYNNDIAIHLKAGRMEPCDLTNNNICTKCDGSGGEKWRKYVGDTTAYHCGFDGYLESRIPDDNNNTAPINECFYDHSGKLVTKGHVDYGCRGTPDYYPSFGGAVSIWNHFEIDAGGPPGPSSSDNYKDISEESKAATKAFYDRNPDWLKYDIGRKYGVNHPKPSE